MKIIKRFQGQAPENKILNYISDSETDGYSCAIINGMSIPIDAIVDYDGDEVPEGYEQVPDYSTTEVKTGKTWINGKPIYRKVISIPITSITGAGTRVAHGISDLDFAFPPKCSWYDTQAETWRNMPSSYFGSLDWASQVLVRTDGDLYFEIGPSALTRIQTKGRDLYVIMEYTKTTD